MRFLLVAMLLLASGPAWAQDFVLIQKGTQSRLYRVNADLTLTAVPFRLVKIDGEEPDPDPPVTFPQGSLSRWVAEKAEKVPAHSEKDTARAALAAVYASFADAWEKGQVDSGSFSAARREATQTILGALGVGEHWKSFDEALVQEIGRRGIKSSEMPKALREVSQGLAGGSALDPRLLPVFAELIQAILTKDRAGLFRAVFKLIPILLSRGG